MGVLCCCCCCCFNNLQSKTLEILAIVFQSISLFFLFCTLAIIKWSKIPVANLILFILMLIINILIIIFTSFIRYWRAKNLIKNTKKIIGQCFSLTCFVLIIICFILCVIEEFVISYGFYNADYPCRTVNYNNPEKSSNYNYYYGKRNLGNDVNCYQVGPDYYANVITDSEFYISYIIFSYLELSFILGLWIWHILRRRIIQGLDGPSPTNVQPVMYDQYGRQVVVVQQGDVVIMDGQPHIAVPAQNQNYNNNNNQFNQSNNQFNQSNNQFNHFNNNQQNYKNNIGHSQNISNQINNNPIPDSQEFNLPEKPH